MGVFFFFFGRRERSEVTVERPDVVFFLLVFTFWLPSFVRSFFFLFSEMLGFHRPLTFDSLGTEKMKLSRWFN